VLNCLQLITALLRYRKKMGGGSSELLRVDILRPKIVDPYCAQFTVNCAALISLNHLILERERESDGSLNSIIIVVFETAIINYCVFCMPNFIHRLLNVRKWHSSASCIHSIFNTTSEMIVFWRFFKYSGLRVSQICAHFVLIVLSQFVLNVP